MTRALLIAAMALLLTACNRGGYPAAYQTNFMQSCQLNGSNEARCTCMWTRIEAQIPVADFVAGEEAIRAGGEHPLMGQLEAISNACAAQP